MRLDEETHLDESPLRPDSHRYVGVAAGRRCVRQGKGERHPSFAIKPEVAPRMIARFSDAGHQAAWVAGDEVYGGNRMPPMTLEQRGVGGRASGRVGGLNSQPAHTNTSAPACDGRDRGSQR
ncbi:hypothetical protein GCM10011583_55050 [Streptomyces camponoticapitis]|uniref:Transposase IS701-like DDE domain-containing protein n=1 Tax=Streptomyces camponoticapitis TaxID=1616125 RepID=A0ABQ2EM03_9ACTN|nr:hypothetical protein GCM10011583_55050 [Streptomyces camponoticapitis]